MPFSFKPEISSQNEGQVPTNSSAATFGDSSSTNMTTRQSESKFPFFQVLLMFAFGFSIFISTAMFAYSYYLNKQIDKKKADLASYESNLGVMPLEDMRKLSNRLKVIHQLINGHPSVNVAFRIIEDSVEHQIIYKRFDLRYDESTRGYALSLGGIAPDYKSITQQTETFKRAPYTTYISNPVIEGVTLDETGQISFSLKMQIKIRGLLPEGLNLSNGAAARLAPVVPVSDILEATSTPPAATTPLGATSTQSSGQQ